MCVRILVVDVLKAKSIFLASYDIVICDLYKSATLSHQMLDFRKEIVIAPRMCFLIFFSNFVLNISYTKNNSATLYNKYTYVFT